ncbi:chromosomal replication initiator protein DnaA [Caulobacter sp. KR2-114]|uniref:chromosomal replication initiator protein DnaA n=1 Tax=Caulobacter sp. KR2-114 TaxID=3400912 RepID=UPI003C09056C
MTNKGVAVMASLTPAVAVWGKASQALKSELGDDTFGSWVAQAALRTLPDGGLCLVTPTGIARDWIRRYAWRRIGELWAANDPDGRELVLKSRLEFEAEGGDVAARAEPAKTAADAPSARPKVIEIAAIDAVSSDAPAAAVRSARTGGLQDRFTFDTFVSGPANEFAHAVARRVASWADGHFNPVVFHGPYGFGKTHLLSALAWEAMRTAPERKVVYLTAERFLSSFVRALMERQANAFKDELRSADLLLIDDVHFIGGKQSSQEELFHTLAALMEDGRRVVFSADRPPAALTEIDARLRSHLSAGLVCGIEPADRDLRLGILDRKLQVLCRQQGFSATLKPEVMHFLADRFTDSVRELEGALNTLVVRAGAGVGALTLDETQGLLRPHLRGGSERRVTVDDIQKATAEHFSLKQADLISERRNRSVARPRQAAMWLAKQLTTRSLPDIGRRFGGRDHTTVLHAVRRIEELRVADAQLNRDLETLMRKLRG